MHANLHSEAVQCGPTGSADLASAAPQRRTGWPAQRGVAKKTQSNTARPRRAARALAAIGLSVLLTACAIPRMIDSQVQSFVGTAGAASTASYRFERLPSQQSAQQGQVEAMAQIALQEVGLNLVTGPDTSPRYSVQVAVQVTPFQVAPRRTSITVAPFVNADGISVYSPLAFWSEPPWYLHTAHFVLRDLSSGQVAYETTGRFEGPWSDSLTLWPVVMRAALQGYPNPPQGTRTVTIELPATAAPSP
jgi:hypothetical protein